LASLRQVDDFAQDALRTRSGRGMGDAHSYLVLVGAMDGTIWEENAGSWVMSLPKP